MSEMINNRQERQKMLKQLILELHGGASVEAVQERFGKLIEGVSATEISEMEQKLIQEGMPVEEVRRLCDVHAAVFKGSIEEIHGTQEATKIPGHPLHTFFQENRALEEWFMDRLQPAMIRWMGAPEGKYREDLILLFEELKGIHTHYSRKENLMFPLLERYEITAPPKVMWGVHDEIRGKIKEAIRSIKDGGTPASLRESQLEPLIHQIKEMIFKEESILFPMAIDTLTEDEWLEIADSSAEIGFFLFTPTVIWKPERKLENLLQMEPEETTLMGEVKFDAGAMTPEEINAILNTVPLDMTFVDKNGLVKYFTQGKERVFDRPKTILGRHVSNCHPPASVHIVEKIVEDLEAGRRDHVDFWIRMGPKFVMIRYFAVRNAEKDFLGVLEVTQNIQPIQEIRGEKRLLSEEETK
ncbi:DUF438 domain-containing protein [Gottschalkiaceae bacterium SANA]|nr:DUF438 domain-containing protein [Gottschalkiaceae bacterium SANA]